MHRYACDSLASYMPDSMILRSFLLSSVVLCSALSCQQVTYVVCVILQSFLQRWVFVQEKDRLQNKLEAAVVDLIGGQAFVSS